MCNGFMITFGIHDPFLQEGPLESRTVPWALRGAMIHNVVVPGRCLVFERERVRVYVEQVCDVIEIYNNLSFFVKRDLSPTHL